MTQIAGDPDLSPAMIAARIDRLPGLTRKHYVLIGILGSIFMFDFIELNTMGFIATLVQTSFHLTTGQLGLLTSTGFGGMFVGALLGGRLSDRLGRKAIMLVGTAIFSVTSLLTVFASTAALFGVLRFISGFGLQMVSGTVIVMVSESFPKANRARVMAVVTAIACISGPILGSMALIFVPRGHWHILYILGAFGPLPGLIAWRFLPESPRWLAVAGRGAEADAQVRAYEDHAVRRVGALPPLELLELREGGSGSESRSSALDIFGRSFIARTIIAALAFCGLILVSYGFSSWAIYTLVSRGYPVTQALTMGLILSTSSILGSLVSYLYVDRVERKAGMMLGLVALAIAFVVFGFAHSLTVVIIAGVLAGLFVQAVSATMYAYVPEIYPVEVRGIGAGFANGVGRVAGIFSSIIITAVITAFTVKGVFVYLPIVAGLMAVILAFGPRVGVREARMALRRTRAPLVNTAALAEAPVLDADTGAVTQTARSTQA